MATIPQRRDSRPAWLLAGLLILLTLLAYVPAMRGGFIWDDNVYLFNNPLIREADGLKRIWLSTDAIEYYPLFYTSFWVEWRLWGKNAPAYHLINILLHLANVLLLWRLLERLQIPGAWWAAVLFAIHPVNVESVAWISERKNTLSLLFFLLSLRAWFAGEGRDRGGGYYWLALVLFLLALLSKTAVAVLPLVLLGAAWWRRGRVSRRDLKRTAPFFVLALGFGLALVWFLTGRDPAAGEVADAGFGSRLLGAGLAVWFYLGKALIPTGLCLVYPRWELDPGRLVLYLPLLGLIGAALLLWRHRHGWGRAPLGGLGYFVICLLPALGLVHHAYLVQSPVADRWQYLPLIGVLALVAAGIGRWYRSLAGRWRLALRFLAPVVLCLLVGLTWSRAALFADAERLNRATLARNPDAAVIRNNLGLLLGQQGRFAEAADQLARAVRADPDYAEARSNLATFLARLGRADEAIAHLREAVRLEPGLPIARFNLATALGSQGQIAEAIAQCEQGLALAPDYLPGRLMISKLLISADRAPAAEPHLRFFLRGGPQNGEARYLLARVLAEQGRTGEAISNYRLAVRALPGLADAYVEMGELLAAEGRIEEAVAAIERALAIDPRMAEAQNALVRLRETHPER